MPEAVKLYALTELSVRAGLPETRILHYIEMRWILPAECGGVPTTARFDEEDLARICLIAELQERLGVNDDAVPVILHLVDRLQQLKRIQSLLLSGVEEPEHQPRRNVS